MKDKKDEEQQIRGWLPKETSLAYERKTSKPRWRKPAWIAITLVAVIALAFAGFYVISFINAGNEPGNFPMFEKISITSAEANRDNMFVITVNFMNDGSADANITNIFINNKPITSYPTFVDVYDASGRSIKSLLNGTGYFIPMAKVFEGNFTSPTGKFTMVFMGNAFNPEEEQILNIVLETSASKQGYSTSCTIHMTSTTSTTTTSTSESITITMVAKNQRFNETNPTINLKAGQTVKFVLVNQDNSGMPYNLCIKEFANACTPVIYPGQTTSLTVTFSTAGNYTYACTVHPTLMDGQIIVQE
jgi:plastocyanin